jgi:starch synthase
MACEVPVVASDVGGIPEVVVDGETGFLVHYDQNNEAAFEHDFAHKLSQVLADSQLGSRMGQAGRNRAVTQFGWDRIANQTLAVYREALESKR